MSIANSVAVTSDAVVSAKGGRIGSVVLTPAAAVSTLILYDNASAASGTVLLSLQAAANGNSAIFAPTDAIAFSNGVYADIGGSGAAAYVNLV